MIYLDNSIEKQEVWIPRNDDLGHVHTGSSQDYQEGFDDGYESGMTDQKNKLVSTAFTENGVYSREDGWSGVTVNVSSGSPALLEDKTVVISADTTVVRPSSGFDGMSAVTVDASEYAQSQYDDGFDDGFTDGYSSGHTDGMDDQKALLSTTAITSNGEYSNENGWSGISVNVPQTGSSISLTSITLTENTAITASQGSAYSAVTVNVDTASTYNSGYTSGQTDQKNLLTLTAFTENGSYEREDGWSGVTVNVDTASTYNSGYTSGHTDGVEEEKAKLSATTFTANTAVTLSDGGYSAVTVNVPQTGHTDQELEDAYQSGYTSGETHQKGLLTTTAFTENGSYSRENGWSGVTVNIDTASTWNSGYTSGYTSGHTDGVDEEKAKMSAVTFTANTAVTLSEGSYSAVTVNVPQTGSSAVLGEGYFISNGTFSASTDNLDGYSAITIDVQDYQTALTICVTGGTWFELDHIFSYGERINIEHLTFDYHYSLPWRHQQLLSGGEGEILRIGAGGDRLYANYGNTDGPSMYIVLSDNEVELTPTEFLVDGTKVADVNSSVYNWETNMVLFANNNSGSDSVEDQTASVGTITITNSAGTVVAQYVPTLDENDIPHFYNPISDTHIYATDGNPMACVVTGQSLQYLSGYTDGQNSIIDTFTAMTATTNGVYGSSANPLSSITVNVPQTGSSGDLNAAFVDRSITSVSIPTACTKVGKSAFSYCKSLTSVTITDNVITIDDYAFSNCETLSNVVFNSGLTKIGNAAFFGCGQSGGTFNNNDLVLPDSVSEIGDEAFAMVPITAITFGTGTTNIGDIVVTSSVKVVYCYATTEPTIVNNTFANLSTTIGAAGVIHYPSGSDYSTWQGFNPNLTFIGDL